MGMIIKAALAMFWLVLIPTVAGIPLIKKKKNYTVVECLFAGYIFLFSSAEILTLLLMWLDAPLHVLTWSYGIIAGIMALSGVLCVLKRIKENGVTDIIKRPRFSFYFWGAVVLILLQTAMCVLLAHMDLDDCFYVATATTDVYTDTIFSINPYTGLEYLRIQKRYILSPFPVFLAVISQLSGGLHPAIVAHVFYPAVFIPMAYASLYYIGKKWFHDNQQAQGIFLLLVVCLTWFSAYSVYNAGNFQMVRIWQGKAFLAAVLLPLLFYFCFTILLEKEKEYPWIFLAMTNLSCCLASSMGIILAPIMMGCFFVVSIFWNRNLKQVFAGVLCCLPSLILGITYLLL